VFFLLVLAVFPLLLGCGIEVPTTPLNPPGTPFPLADTTNPTFTIKCTTQNNEPDFRGFELYYKFYKSSAEIEAGLSNVTEYDLRIKNNFAPVCFQEDTFSVTPPQNLHSSTSFKPLLFVQPLDRGTAFDITITFSSIPQTQPIVKYNGTQYTIPNLPAFSDAGQDISIRRNVGDVDPASSFGGQGKFFIKPYTGYQTYISSDRDVQSIWDTVQPGGTGSGVVYLAMYAMSYGIQNFTSDIFSQPVYLGYVQISTYQ
jgi:hypothetical protein